MSETLDGVSPTLPNVIRAALESRLTDVHTALPAIVESYDAERQSVDVRPALRRTLQARDGSKILEDLPKLQDVPVAWPRAGGFFLHMPIAAGDFVLVVFSERAHGEFRALGDAVDPGDQRLHGLSGAVAFPGFFPDARALVTADASSDMALGKEGSGPQIRIDASAVKLGGTAASDFVALASLVTAQLNALKSAISTAVPAPNDGGAALKAAILASLASWPTTIAATKVKAL